MKKAICIMVILAMIFVSCMKTEKPDGIEECVSSYMESDYSYRKTTTYYNDHNEEMKVVLDGQYTAKPYKETITIEEGSDNSLWDYAIYEGEGDLVAAKLHTDSGWIETKIKREYPYGYKEKLNFDAPYEKHVNNKLCEVYATEYTINIGGSLHQTDNISAVIYQTYYREKETGRLIRVDSDLTE